MSFLKVMVKQQTEGKPGFAAEEEFEVQIAINQITLFNKSDDDPDVVFVRLTCGATLCVAMKYNAFITAMNKALLTPGQVGK